MRDGGAPGRVPLPGTMGAARWFRAARRGPVPGGGARAGRGDRAAGARPLVPRAGQRGAPGAAGHLRRPRPRPPDAGRQRRAPGARPRPARTPRGRRRQQRALGAGRRTAPAGRLRPGRRAPRPAGLRPRPDPRRRRRTGQVQDRVLVAGHRLLPARVHRRRAAPGVRGRVGGGPRPAQLPPQGHRDPRVPRADGGHHHTPGRPPRPALQGWWRHPAQPPDAAPRGLTGADPAGQDRGAAPCYTERRTRTYSRERHPPPNPPIHEKTGQRTLSCCR
ncbi:hypothetical protein SGPA1_11188 [Streptomyces misionensis JCM 4497]